MASDIAVIKAKKNPDKLNFEASRDHVNECSYTSDAKGQTDTGIPKIKGQDGCTKHGEYVLEAKKNFF